MFSVIFPGQGSQFVGMGKELVQNYHIVKDLFQEADDNFKFSFSDLLINGPKDALDRTENTQPAIFLIGYAIFKLLKNEYGINLNKAQYFAGHSLGEYTALSCSGALNFIDTINLLKKRGQAMQSALPLGEGGMVAILGSKIETIENILNNNNSKYKCFIANDNSNVQSVVSGKMKDIDLLIDDLNKNSIKSIKLSVSAPFHCKYMSKATEIMKKEIENLNLNKPSNKLVSNVSATEVEDLEQIKKLLVDQIESRVRWRESIIYMINNKVTKFIEIGPGKVLNGLIKRIDKNVEVISINNKEEMSELKKNGIFQ
ncbi:MAG: [acyl-carrier-protein] S-malonyltransferase [Pelagibacteraceae bacterium TMED287]|nr:MAG: [acyl-carrier-protein] S-malonyltransferase [Pelagibacteraceae bacterium TMED287]|tara:strand:- start:34 stop:975 length:942 start_codon:yes stop_codon:yes gene_type:complete